MFLHSCPCKHFSSDVLHPSVGYLTEERSLLLDSPRGDSAPASLDEALLRCSFRFVYRPFGSGLTIFLSFPDLMSSSTLKIRESEVLLSIKKPYKSQPKNILQAKQCGVVTIDVSPLYELSFCYEALSWITPTFQPKFQLFVL